MKWKDQVAIVVILATITGGFILICQSICQQTASRQAAVHRPDAARYANEFADFLEGDQ